MVIMVGVTVMLMLCMKNMPSQEELKEAERKERGGQSG